MPKFGARYTGFNRGTYDFTEKTEKTGNKKRGRPRKNSINNSTGDDFTVCLQMIHNRYRVYLHQTRTMD